MLATLFFFVSEHGPAFAVPECTEATTTGKYWEYRDFFIRAGIKRGLRKGKGNNKINGERVNEALNELLPNQSGWTTRQHIDNIEPLIPTLAGFQGAEGLISLVWVEIAEKAMKHYTTDSLAKKNKIEIDVWGRIDENNIEPHPSEAGYRYDFNDGSGHLWATMCFELRWAHTRGNQDPDAKIRYSIKTEVAKCGFSVIPRGSFTGNDPIFTESRLYDKKTWRNSNPAFRGRGNKKFKIKLEAGNSEIGDAKSYECPPTPVDGYVTLGAAFFDKGDGAGWADLGDKHGPYGYLFNPSLEACIDILFATNSPPPSLSNPTEWPNYCLGRCSDPPVINSGM